MMEFAFAVVRIWRTFSKGMPLKSASMSARESIATRPFRLRFGHRVVGVVAHLRRQVKRDGEARAALLYDVTEATVGFLSGGESRVLPHRPELAVAVHVLADAACERIVARFTELGLEVLALYVFFGVYALQLVARQRRMFSFFRH